MKIRLYLINIIIMLSVISSKGQRNEAIVNGIYKNYEIGWLLSIPKGWTTIPVNVRESSLKIADQKTHTTSDQSSTIKLLSFRKSAELKNPIFMSGLIKKRYLTANGITSPQKYIEYELQLMSKSNVKISKSFGIKTIDSQTFTSYTFKNTESSVVQKGLVCFRHNYLFYLTWVYQNEDDDKIIERAIETSKFTKN